jgi:hypothetical protein
MRLACRISPHCCRCGFFVANVMGFARFEISKPPVAREMRGQRRLSRDSCGFEVYVEISLDVDEFLFIYFLGD